MVKNGLLVLALLALSACSTTDENKEQAQLFLQNGTGHLIKGQYPQALASLLHAQKMDPDNPIIYNNLGLTYYLRKEFDLAIKNFEKAIDLNSKYTDARNNLGRVLIATGKLDDAIQHLSEASKDLVYTMPEKVFANLALAYLKKKQYPQCIAAAKKSISLNNKYCHGHNYYGLALFEQKKYAVASEFFERALALCENNYDEAHYYSAVSLDKLGQIEKARARYEEVVRRYPASEFAEKARQHLLEKTDKDSEK